MFTRLALEVQRWMDKRINGPLGAHMCIRVCVCVCVCVSLDLFAFVSTELQ